MTTVAELIEHLQTLVQDAQVEVGAKSSSGRFVYTDIDLEKTESTPADIEYVGIVRLVGE